MSLDKLAKKSNYLTANELRICKKIEAVRQSEFV